MKNTLKTIAVSLSLLCMIVPFQSVAAYAQDQNINNLMSYAPTDNSGEERFKDFDLDRLSTNYEEPHELNDAWLGISAYSSDGEYLGYIEDAFIDANGNVTELVVAPPNGDVSVQLAASDANLLKEEVVLKLTKQEFAGILTNGEVVASVN